LKDDLVSRGVADSKITLIPNAVELDKFIHRTPDEAAKQALRDKLQIGEAYVLGFIGSFYAYEGLDILIRAMQALANSDKPYSLLLVGGGPEDARLKALAKELNVEDKITFTGRVPHAEVANYYDLVDLLVFPRKSMRLTELVTPLKPLEAMAQKKLVLASDVGGHKELIDDSKNGYLFTADDENELAEKIIDISSKQHSVVLDEGLRFVKDVRNWKVSVSNYLPVYEGLLKK
jgi:glycosyltransferase involved in cell wall biosynthesis